MKLPADLGPLDGGTPAGPGFVQALEVEQALGEALFEDGEGFGGSGHGADQGQYEAFVTPLDTRKRQKGQKA